MNANLLTTVIGLEVVFGAPPGAAQQGDFQRVIGMAARHFAASVLGGVVGNAIQMIVVVAPDQPVAAALRRLSGAMDEMLESHPAALLRLLANHGVVFANTVDGRTSYSGSALRSLQSALRRLSDLDGLFATREFAAHVASWAQSPLRLDPVRDIEGLEGLSEIRFDGSFVLPAVTPDVVGVNDPALIQLIKRRLADEIGPFAGALVDAALRTAPSAVHLIKEVAAEIDDMAARKRFEADIEKALVRGK